MTTWQGRDEKLRNAGFDVGRLPAATFRARIFWMQLVTVFEAFQPADAELVWSQLDAAGFPAQIANELSALSTDGYSLATGGIQVKVPADRAEEARAFLDANSDPGRK